MEISNVIKQIRTLAYSDHRYSLLAEYILNNINDVVNYRIVDFATKTFSSPATISRFVKKIGLNGYGDLQQVLKFYIQSISGDRISYQQNSLNLQHLELFHKATIRSLNETHNLIQINHLEQVSQQLIKASEIIVLSSSEHYWACFDLVEKLTRIGLNVKFNISENMQFAHTILSNENSLILAVSYSGNDEVINNYLRNVKNNKSFVITITKLRESTFARMGNMTLCVLANESILRHVSLTSNIAIIYLLNILFISVLKSNNGKYNFNLKKTSSVANV